MKSIFDLITTYLYKGHPMKTKQNGFAHAFLIIGLIVALIGALGFVFWQNFIHKEPVRTEVISVSPINQDNKKSTNESKTEPENKSIVVKEWGIKLNSSVVNHLEYDISSRIGGTQNTEYDSLGLKIKRSSVDNQDCMNFGADLYRQKVATEFESKKIGDYFYYVTGAPGQCSENADDLKLQQTVLDELRIDNVSKLE